MSLRDRAHFASMQARTAVATATLAKRTRDAVRPPPAAADGPLRVLFLAGRPADNAGTRSRLTAWAERLRVLGHDATVDLAVPSPRGEELYRDWDAPAARAEYHRHALRSRIESVERAREADVVVIHLTDLPHWEYGEPFVAEALRRVCPRVLLDLDDLPVVRGESTIGERARALANCVDGLILGNRELFAHYPDRPAWHVPTCVDTEQLPVRGRTSASEHGSGAERAVERPVLGWIGTRGRLPPLERIAPALASVCAQHDAVVRVICDRAPELPGVPFEFVPWAAKREGAAVAEFDVGLAPLDDGPVERCKCGLKGLQYLAAGVPVVASPVGVLAEIASPAVGAVASTNDEWERALGALLADPDRRRAAGAAARESAVARWSFGAHEARFVDALRGASADARQAARSGG